MLELVATLGAATVVITYFLSTKMDNPLIFAWGNVAGACMMVPVNVVLSLQFAVVLNGMFGVLGAYAIVKHYREAELPKTFDVGDVGHNHYGGTGP